MSHWPVVQSVKLVVMRALNQEKLTSPSGCVLVYDSTGEPAKHSVRGSGECSASGSEFEVGGANSGEDFPRRVSRRAPLAAVAESWYCSCIISMVVFPGYIHDCVVHFRH